MTAEVRDELLTSLFNQLQGSKVHAPTTAIPYLSSSYVVVFSSDTKELEILLADDILQHMGGVTPSVSASSLFHGEA
ncbi:polyketide synthase [Colletotrichum tofieldiae]|nr:polyketide synthase [Colletotrichum tofieldiae]